ncbi:methyltransferase family protein [Atribacter laminatus]|uniref:Protein-S-isoprenylcysteine O-methyltransferase Ste14 n=1 Tax=Atribacter laminatus TaxID=2847778 RepID=A0A7T1AJ46_ATRLM|nr:methyltransferase [Atribacter laminatus]QPM66867.1 hypothetical protein RT761_00053 [Atribacter laminatus]
MFNIILCLVLIFFIWIINGKFIYQGFKKKIWNEFFIHTGFGLIFTLLITEITLGPLQVWKHGDIELFKIIGYVFFAPSIYFVFTSMTMLKSKGNPIGSDRYGTTQFVDQGIYGIIRQPMTLGMALWSLALIFLFQSIFSLVLGGIEIFFFWISARMELNYNIKKFGDRYRKYAEKIPMWNFFFRKK